MVKKVVFYKINLESSASVVNLLSNERQLGNQCAVNQRKDWKLLQGTRPNLSRLFRLQGSSFLASKKCCEYRFIFTVMKRNIRYLCWGKKSNILKRWKCRLTVLLFAEAAVAIFPAFLNTRAWQRRMDVRLCTRVSCQTTLHALQASITVTYWDITDVWMQ